MIISYASLGSPLVMAVVVLVNAECGPSRGWAHSWGLFERVISTEPPEHCLAAAASEALPWVSLDRLAPCLGAGFTNISRIYLRALQGLPSNPFVHPEQHKHKLYGTNQETTDRDSNGLLQQCLSWSQLCRAALPDDLKFFGMNHPSALAALLQVVAACWSCTCMCVEGSL